MLLDICVALEPIKHEVDIEKDLDNPIYYVECNHLLNGEGNEKDVGRA